MNVFFNCSNLRFGGGITVAYNILKYYKDHRKQDNILLVAPSDCGYERFKGDNVKVVTLASHYNKAIFKPFLNNILLPRYIKRFNTDCIISLGNIAIRVNKPQILLIMFPYIAYPESEVWNRLSFLTRFIKKQTVNTIRNNSQYANTIFVQTETMKQRLASQFPSMSNKLIVVPCAVSFTSKKNIEARSLNTYFQKIKLLILSKYYVHKNFEILIPLAKEIIQQKLNITITTTLCKTENAGALNFLKQVKDNNLEKVIINIGHVQIESVADVYATHDGLLLPTLLESFSGTYIESFYFGKPIFTSDLDFAHDACKDAAFFFDPLNAGNIFQVITKAFKNPELIKQKTELGKKYLKDYKTWNETGKMFEDEMMRIAKN